MESKNEMDDLLKRSMQFDADELPELDPAIQNSLRGKIKPKKAYAGNKFTAGLMQFLNLDIKLYHAGLAMAAMFIVFIALHHTSETTKTNRGGIIVADTNIGNTLKDDTFLVKSFSTRIN